MRIKPVEDRLVPDPQRGDTLPATGREVEATNYWLRRLADGDITIVAANEADAAPTEKKSR